MSRRPRDDRNHRDDHRDRSSYRSGRYADIRSYRDDYDDRDRGRVRDRDRRDYDRDRDRDRYRDRGERDRDRERRREYDSRNKDNHPRSSRGKRGGRKRARRGRRQEERYVRPPPPPYDAICHICERNHWTVECDRLYKHPEDYPYLDRKRGCWKCGKRGHAVAECRAKRYRCKECGGVHSTKDCYYDHKPEEWHEFFDPFTKHTYYVNNANHAEVSWEPPTHEFDEVLWYCDVCQLLIPNKYKECLKCHKVRPESTEESESSSDSSDGSYSDEDSTDELSQFSD